MNLAVIPARGGSKRIPRKNIRPFGGMPMIAWSIRAAAESGCFDRIIVSTDDVASHEKFRDKYELNFPLLADVDHKVADKYGAWREKNMYGKKSWGVQRSTFLIDAEGIVRKVWKKVSVDGHDQQVLEALAKLGG